MKQKPTQGGLPGAGAAVLGVIPKGAWVPLHFSGSAYTVWLPGAPQSGGRGAGGLQPVSLAGTEACVALRRLRLVAALCRASVTPPSCTQPLHLCHSLLAGSPPPLPPRGPHICLWFYIIS